MGRILKVVVSTAVLLMALLLIGIFVFRVDGICLVLEEFYMNFSWQMFYWLIVTGFITGIWFGRTLYVAIKSNQKDKKAEAKAEEAKGNVQKAKK